ncbi:unnamed protein product [Sphagnum balticum]
MEQRITRRFDFDIEPYGPQRGAVVPRALGFGVIRLVGIELDLARVGDITVEVTHSGYFTRARVWLKTIDGAGGWTCTSELQSSFYFTSYFAPQGMDELFWGREHEDVTDWAERLTMAAKKYEKVDDDDIRAKLDAIKQEPRERVQKYFERLDRLFQRGRITDAEQRRRILARLRPKIRKLCVVRTFADIEELVGAASELERVLGEIGETPFEPLKEELEKGAADASMGPQVAALNDTLINFFKGGLGHSENRCWKKPKDGRSNSGVANFLEVLLDNKIAIIEQLNRFCENENVFSYTRIPKRRQPVELTPVGAGPSAEVAEDGIVTNREHSIRSKILSHFIKGKISLTPMETVMMIPGELEQLENLVKVARRKKDAETEGAQVSMVSAAPAARPCRSWRLQLSGN